MKISVNWMKQLVDFELPPVDELVRKIGSQLGEVEEVVDLGKKYQGIIVAKVVECREHENSDHLHVCKIDDGGKAQSVERDDNGLVQVVCGAPNVREGLMVAWLPPGSTVPSTIPKDPFVLEARELRGERSNGMLASAHELGISDDHDGILEIDKEAQPGDDFAQLYKLDDYIIDIENKMFTHRPDCFGALGVAREIAGILGHRFTSPDWYKLEVQIPEAIGEHLPLEVRNELPELVPRFMVLPISNVQVRPSPIWLQVALSKLGQKPINNIVDLTNFYMLLAGQPTHAYDYDKVKALSGQIPTLAVRYPKAGEKVLLLNGKEIEPRSEAIMIATDQKIIGVGGVMGGAETEVSDSTKNIIIECATFDMYSIRRTSMANGLFTDAVTRFNKGQSPIQNPAVLVQLVKNIAKLSGGTPAGQLIDDNHVNAETIQRSSVHPLVNVSEHFINERLGLRLPATDMKALLENVEFSVDETEGNLTVTAPFWRTDIEIPEDVVEEVGRLYGFDHLPLELPKRAIVPAQRDTVLELKTRLRNFLASAGANELLTYSFVHGNLLDKVGQDKSAAFQLSNALSPDLQYYRLSLTPSLLEKIHPNIKAGYDQFALFELGKAHIQGATDKAGLPAEFERLALVFSANDKAAKAYRGSAYYQARRYLMHVLELFGAASNVSFEPLQTDDADQATRYYEPSRAATLRIGDTIIGRIGEYRPAVRQALKLPAFTAGFELGLEPLRLAVASFERYVPIPRFPKVQQDISLKVPSGVTYQQVFHAVREGLAAVQPEGAVQSLAPVDIYQREGDTQYKHFTLRFTLASHERTLTDAEVAKMLDHAAMHVKEHLPAERV